jgi:hypothetical protein
MTSDGIVITAAPPWRLMVTFIMFMSGVGETWIVARVARKCNAFDGWDILEEMSAAEPFFDTNILLYL